VAVVGAAVVAVEVVVADAAPPQPDSIVELRALPRLGAGISFREEWRWEVVRHRDRLGVIEVVADDIVGDAARRRLTDLRYAVPVILHGIGLSLGSADGLDADRLDHLARLVDALQPPWLSEHIAVTRAGGVEIGHLTPLPFTREAVDTVARNVDALRRAVPGVPILLENIAYTVVPPGAEMSEAEFVREVVLAADCGLLLDLENVHANAANHGYDPVAHLESLPLDRVAEVHLAGGLWDQGTYADTHTRPVPEASWSLLEWLAQRTDVHAVIIERDDDLPPFEELLSEVDRAAAVVRANPVAARRA
jgi:uncharacterized protein